VLYLDAGVNWNASPNTQFYAKIDNLANVLPPDAQSQLVVNSVFDVIGRMYRIGVRVID
jgi:outer membrane receptor protein involved in Fe transport